MRNMRDEQTQRYMIQVERPQEKLDMQKIAALLEPLDIRLDPDYGPINVNPKLGRYIVRGSATEAAREKAEQIEGVRFFRDAKVAPTKQ